MKNREKINLIVAVIAIMISIGSFFYSNLREPDIDFVCGLEMELEIYSDDNIGAFIPFSFVNRSTQSGIVLDVKLSIYPKDSFSDKVYHWCNIWQYVSEKDTVTGFIRIDKRLIGPRYPICVNAKATEIKFINFYPIRTTCKFTMNTEYIIDVSVLTAYSGEWLTKTYSFLYQNNTQVIITELN